LTGKEQKEPGMRKNLIFALILNFISFPTWAQESFWTSTSAKLRDAGYSDSFISKIKRNSSKIYRQTAHSKTILGQDASSSIPTPSDTPMSIPTKEEAQNSGDLKPTDFVVTKSNSEDLSPPPAPTGSHDEAPPAELPPTTDKPSLPPPPGSEDKASLPPLNSNRDEKATKTNGKNGKTKTKSKTSSKKGKKSTKIKSSVSSAPVVKSLPEPSQALPATPYSGNGDQEIYSQEPLSLPPVSQLPTPTRTTLPPVSRDTLMTTPLGEAVSRVLACNFMGLTGLNQTTSADVSKEGSFKMGFHTNWFILERVYDRVLASGESGKIFEAPLFFNYSATNDLEFALMLPILDYTVKSRILWPADFRHSGLGDTKLSFKYRVFDNPQYQMRGAFGVGFKFPTGSDKYGICSGKNDFEVFVAFSKNFEKVIAHLNLGYIMTGDPNTLYYPSGLADIFYYNVGIEYPHNHNVTVAAEVNGMDWGSEGLKVDVTPTVRYTPTENFAFDVAVPISVTNDQRYGYNYRLTFGVTAFFK